MANGIVYAILWLNDNTYYSSYINLTRSMVSMQYIVATRGIHIGK